MREAWTELIFIVAFNLEVHPREKDGLQTSSKDTISP